MDLSIGVIILWSGSLVSIPAGWQLCNGTNGTPDLRNRFVPCAGGSLYAVGATGGGYNGLLAHSHAVNISGLGSTSLHRHTLSGETELASAIGPNLAFGPDTGPGYSGDSHKHTYAIVTSAGSPVHVHGVDPAARYDETSSVTPILRPAGTALYFIQRMS